MGSYEDLTYKIVSREYGGVNTKLRNITIRTIPKGTILYHYYQNDFYGAETTTSKEIYSKTALIRYYSRFGFQSIEYNEADDTVVFELSRSLVNPKYFFGVPHAVYGVYQGDTYYNTMIPVIVKEDMHVAFLKSGADSNDSSTLHRGYPSRNFNYERVSACSSVKNCEGNVCGIGDDTDMCLRKEFASQQNLDGIAAIAENDSLYDENGKPQELYRVLEHYSNQIKKRPTDFEINILHMILLGLDYDQRGRKTIAGFTEYALHPFGKKGYKGEHFLPPSTDGFYTIVEEVAGERQKIKTSFANFKGVFETYIKPNLVVDPLCVLDVTRSNKGAILFDNDPNFMKALITKGKYPSRIEKNEFEKGSVVDPSVFFEWALDAQYMFLYNPLINMFGIYKPGYPFSYPPADFRYRNDFIVNEKLPYKDLVKRDFTNVFLGKLVHVLSFIDVSGVFRLQSSAITNALEAKLFRGKLNKTTADAESELNTVYLYQPVWKGANLTEEDMPTENIKQRVPKIIVYSGNRREIYTDSLVSLLNVLYEGLVSPYILDITNEKYIDYITTYKYRDDVEGDFTVLGTIVPPMASMTKGGQRKTRKYRRRHKQRGKRITRRTK